MSNDFLNFQAAHLSHHGETSVHSPNINQFYEERGDYDGRIFYSDSKVTYTFLNNHEVISLHYDQNRGEIFFNGHSLSNHTLNIEEIGFLDKFRFALSRDEKTQVLIKNFDQILNSYKQRFFDN